MKITKYPIYLWALFDLISVGYIVLRWISWKTFPFQNEIIDIFNAANDPSMPLGGLIAVALVILDISVFFSAYFLIRQKKVALYICYPQALLRIFFSYSTIPFLNTPVIPIESSVIIISIIEYIKLLTLFVWHIYFINKSNLKISISKLRKSLVKFKTFIILYVLFETFGIFINYLDLYLAKGYNFINIFSWRTILVVLIGALYIFFRKNVFFQNIISTILTLTFLLSSYNFITKPLNDIPTNILFIVINIYFVTAGSIIAFTTYKNKKNIT